MTTGSRIVFLPGDVSLDIIEAVHMAAGKIKAQKNRLSMPASLESTKNKIATLPRPVRYLNTPKQIEETKKEKAIRIKRELIDAGITLYGLLKPEARFLYKVLHSDEHVEAVVYGQHRSSSVMLVATDERIIFLDKKPMAVFMDEVSYEVVSGIEFEIHTLTATLILHTPVKNYDIRYANLHCAENFARHIEAHRLRREKKEEVQDPAPPIQVFQLPRQLHDLPNDLAGYYWLPTEPENEEKK